jgi:hypothetical protein
MCIYWCVCVYVCVYVYVCIHVYVCVLLYLLVTLLGRATVYVGWCDRGERTTRSGTTSASESCDDSVVLFLSKERMNIFYSRLVPDYWQFSVLGESSSMPASY